jgi:hypothetical protein
VREEFRAPRATTFLRGARQRRQRTVSTMRRCKQHGRFWRHGGRRW